MDVCKFLRPLSDRIHVGRTELLATYQELLQPIVVPIFCHQLQIWYMTAASARAGARLSSGLSLRYLARGLWLAGGF